MPMQKLMANLNRDNVCMPFLFQKDQASVKFGLRLGWTDPQFSETKIFSSASKRNSVVAAASKLPFQKRGCCIPPSVQCYFLLF